MRKITLGTVFNSLAVRKFFTWIPSDKFLKIQYRIMMGKPLNLDNPKTFNEKLQWLKINDKQPRYTSMVDKYEAKEYASQIIGDEYIIPTLGVWDKFSDIDFDKLPNRFVLKCTHDSGGLVICKDKSKLDFVAANKKINKCMRRNFYDANREWPYKNVKPRIIAEKYIAVDGDDLPDYKVHCFNGEPKFVLVCRDRFSTGGLTEDFYDTNWNLMDVKRPHIPHGKTPMDRPPQLEEILELSKKLAKDTLFLRVDFYIIEGKVYFGELTFFPASGHGKFEPEEYDKTIGDWISLNEKTEH